MHDLQRLVAGLNPEQRQAVESTEGPVLVLAGAGSGKTRVIIHRIAYLLAKGVRPERILAVTFTNKAANEMKERIGQMVDAERAGQLHISTFHSLGLWMVRRSRRYLGVTSSTSVMDESDRNSVVRAVRQELGWTDKDLSLDETEEFLMQVKGCGEDPEAIAGRFGARKRFLQLKFLDQYTRRLRLAESLDFDDLILLPVTLLEKNDKVREEYRELFDYIMVDEYQDTNFLQFRLLKQLVGPAHNICVVGDDDQSIYGWRGARVENILEFDQQFPGATVVKLTRNYRSQRNILQLANALIARNQHRREKELWTEAADEVPAIRLRFETQGEEARALAERIRNMIRGGGVAPRQLAVLYRTKGQSRVLQEQFRMAGIPYRVVGSYDFFERKEVRDILAYIRLVCNPHDQASFRRVVNYPTRGIGLTTLEKLEQYREQSRSHLSAAREMLARDGESLQPRTRRSLEQFVCLLERHHRETRPLTGKQLPAAVSKLLEDAGVRDDLIVRGEYPYKAMTTLLSMLERGLVEGVYNDLPQFLERLTLDQREADFGDSDEPENLVTLMTVHSSKGLEFDAVIIAGLVENLFPHFKSVDSPAGLEEERRLFYVALTRARKQLFVSTFRQREERGKPVRCRASRFLGELPAELLHTRTDMGEKFVEKADLLAAFDAFDLGK